MAIHLSIFSGCAVSISTEITPHSTIRVIQGSKATLEWDVNSVEAGKFIYITDPNGRNVVEYAFAAGKSLIERFQIIPRHTGSVGVVIPKVLIEDAGPYSIYNTSERQAVTTLFVYGKVFPSYQIIEANSPGVT